VKEYTSALFNVPRNGVAGSNRPTTRLRAMSAERQYVQEAAGAIIVQPVVEMISNELRSNRYDMIRKQISEFSNPSLISAKNFDLLKPKPAPPVIAPIVMEKPKMKKR
jgi:hypothetical protein